MHRYQPTIFPGCETSFWGAGSPMVPFKLPTRDIKQLIDTNKKQYLLLTVQIRHLRFRILFSLPHMPHCQLSGSLPACLAICFSKFAWSVLITMPLLWVLKYVYRVPQVLDWTLVSRGKKHNTERSPAALSSTCASVIPEATSLVFPATNLA